MRTDALCACVLWSIVLGTDGQAAPAGNGDVNASGTIDIADAIYLLGWLFGPGDPPVPIVCPPPGGGPLPATGQWQCYTDRVVWNTPCETAGFPGQDGFYGAGCPSAFRFVDNGDATVTDDCTGLVWQKDTADTNADGSVTPDDQLTWQEALRYCDRLDFAGNRDWRLPNVQELQSLVDWGRTGGDYSDMYPHPLTDDRAAIDPVLGAERDFYWSGTSNTQEPQKAWFVVFWDGHSLGTQNKSEKHFVRSVRVWQDTTVFGQGSVGRKGAPSGNGDMNGSGAIDIADAVYLLSWLFGRTDRPMAIICPPRGGGPLAATGQTKCYTATGEEIPCDNTEFPGQDGFYQAGCPAANRFVDNRDGTVTDHCTGLMWQKDTAEMDGDGAITLQDEVDWQHALWYCDHLELGGYSDWRLPNVRELQSLVDYGRVDPAIDPIFGAISEGTFGRYSERYCTSTTHLRTPDDVWVIGFRTGITSDTQKRISPADNNVQLVRAVRGGCGNTP